MHFLSTRALLGFKLDYGVFSQSPLSFSLARAYNSNERKRVM